MGGSSGGAQRPGPPPIGNAPATAAAQRPRPASPDAVDAGDGDCEAEEGDTAAAAAGDCGSHAKRPRLAAARQQLPPRSPSASPKGRPPPPPSPQQRRPIDCDMQHDLQDGLAADAEAPAAVQLHPFFANRRSLPGGAVGPGRQQARGAGTLPTGSPGPATAGEGGTAAQVVMTAAAAGASSAVAPGGAPNPLGSPAGAASAPAASASPAAAAAAAAGAGTGPAWERLRDAVLQPLQSYDPVRHACWGAGQPAPYLHIALALQVRPGGGHPCSFKGAPGSGCTWCCCCCCCRAMLMHMQLGMASDVALAMMHVDNEPAARTDGACVLHPLLAVG